MGCCCCCCCCCCCVYGFGCFFVWWCFFFISSRDMFMVARCWYLWYLFFCFPPPSVSVLSSYFGRFPMPSARLSLLTDGLPASPTRVCSKLWSLLRCTKRFVRTD